jgi:hypothetical protein
LDLPIKIDGEIKMFLTVKHKDVKLYK